jgi:cytochrome c oxidase assembly protein subunit 11
MAVISQTPNTKKNQQTLVALLMVAVGMVMLAYAAVPLYRLFCQVTGFSGTTMLAASAPAPEAVLNQMVTVDFDTKVAPGLPLEFHAEEAKVDMKIGENRLTFYRVKNTSDRPITVMATYNVVPHDLGAFLNKTECFCFENLTLAPYEDVQLPISFFIDPAVVENPYLKKIQRITLSYTFFEVKNAEATASKPAQ